MASQKQKQKKDKCPFHPPVLKPYISTFCIVLMLAVLLFVPFTLMMWRFYQQLLPHLTSRCSQRRPHCKKAPCWSVEVWHRRVNESTLKKLNVWQKTHRILYCWGEPVKSCMKLKKKPKHLQNAFIISGPSGCFGRIILKVIKEMLSLCSFGFQLRHNSK